jgi:hypothetical protein
MVSETTDNAELTVDVLSDLDIVTELYLVRKFQNLSICFTKNILFFKMMYLFTIIGLTSDGSSTLNIYTQTIHSTTQGNRIHRILHTQE